jgi:hypothetical protein
VSGARPAPSSPLSPSPSDAGDGDGDAKPGATAPVPPFVAQPQPSPGPDDSVARWWLLSLLVVLLPAALAALPRFAERRR